MTENVATSELVLERVARPESPAPAEPAATTTSAKHFAEAAVAHGYNEKATRTMVEAASTLRLPLDEATAWLAAGITPWGAQAWKAEGFADGDEARSYRARGFTPANAYQDRVDERGRARVANRRAGNL